IDGGGRAYRIGADRGDVDELAAALALHQRQPGGDAVQHAADVHVDHPVPFVQLEGVQAGQRHHAGIVDDHVDPAELLAGVVDEGLGALAAGDVQPAEQCRTARLVDLSGECLQTFHPSRTQYDLGALVRQQTRGGFADATAGTGYEDDFAADVRHVASSAWFGSRSTVRAAR